MSLGDKIKDITAEFEKKGISADPLKILRARMKGWKRSPYVHVVVNDVRDEDRIQLSANLQEILGDALGYGAVTVKYNPDDQKLTLNYIPVGKEEPNRSLFGFLGEKIGTALTPGSTDSSSGYTPRPRRTYMPTPRPVYAAGGSTQPPKELR